MKALEDVEVDDDFDWRQLAVNTEGYSCGDVVELCREVRVAIQYSGVPYCLSRCRATTTPATRDPRFAAVAKRKTCPTRDLIFSHSRVCDHVFAISISRCHFRYAIFCDLVFAVSFKQLIIFYHLNFAISFS